MKRELTLQVPADLGDDVIPWDASSRIRDTEPCFFLFEGGCLLSVVCRNFIVMFRLHVSSQFCF